MKAPYRALFHMHGYEIEKKLIVDFVLSHVLRIFMLRVV